MKKLNNPTLSSNNMPFSANKGMLLVRKKVGAEYRFSGKKDSSPLKYAQISIVCAVHCLCLSKPESLCSTIKIKKEVFILYCSRLPVTLHPD